GGSARSEPDHGAPRRRPVSQVPRPRPHRPQGGRRMSPPQDAPDSAADDAPVAGRSRARRLRRIALEVVLVGLAYAAVTGYQGRGHLPHASLAPDFDVELLD